MADNYYSAPFTVDFIITQKCNLRCNHCNLNGGDELASEMSTQQIKDVLDQLYAAGVMEVAFSGGEILCRSDWQEIVAYAVKLASWPIILNTNGLLWLEDDFRFVQQFPQIRLAISSDGYDPDSYAILRRLPSGRPADGQFARLVQMIEQVQSHGIRFNINIMLTGATLDGFFATIHFYQQMEIKNFLGIKFFPAGRGYEHKAELEISYDRWATFLDAVIAYRQDNPALNLGILVPCPWEMYLPLLSKGYSVEDVYRLFRYKSLLLNDNYREIRDLGCHAGITTCTIFPDGSVLPCAIVPASLQEWNCGNVCEQSFQEIWDTSAVFTALRQMTLQDVGNSCQACDLSGLCGGGCRARALVLAGDVEAPDPSCPRTK